MRNCLDFFSPEGIALGTLKGYYGRYLWNCICHKQTADTEIERVDSKRES